MIQNIIIKNKIIYDFNTKNMQKIFESNSKYVQKCFER